MKCISGCDINNVGYASTIELIVNKRCVGCHSGNALGGGIALGNYNQIANIARDGRFLGVVKHLKGFKAMPLGGQKIPVCEIQQIEKWIENGALND